MLKINNLAEILQEELPEIIKKIAFDSNVSDYIKNPDFLEERLYSWHQFGLLTHTKKVREVFLNELNNKLKNWGVYNKIQTYLEEKIDERERKELFEISINFHDLGKILVQNAKPGVNREHEFLSGKLISKGFLEKKLINFGLSNNQIRYIGKVIETHDVLGKQLRDVLKHADKLKLDYIDKNPNEIKELCQEIYEKYPKIKVELGIFFLCDVLGKTDIRINAESDSEIKEKEKEIEDKLKERNLSKELKKAVMQLPVNMKLAGIYLNNLFK